MRQNNRGEAANASALGKATLMNSRAGMAKRLENFVF
jgi:hypothetical protein